MLTAVLISQLMHKLSVEAPPKILVERYLIEIARNYNVPYEPDAVVQVSSTGAETSIGQSEGRIHVLIVLRYNRTPFVWPAGGV